VHFRPYISFGVTFLSWTDLTHFKVFSKFQANDVEFYRFITVTLTVARSNCLFASEVVSKDLEAFWLGIDRSLNKISFCNVLVALKMRKKYTAI